MQDQSLPSVRMILLIGCLLILAGVIFSGLVIQNLARAEAEIESSPTILAITQFPDDALTISTTPLTDGKGTVIRIENKTPAAPDGPATTGVKAR